MVETITVHSEGGYVTRKAAKNTIFEFLRGFFCFFLQAACVKSVHTI